MKAKYTPRTNLKICTPDISLLQRILYQYRALQPSIDTEKITPQFSVAVPLSNAIGTADNTFWSNLAKESQQEFKRSGTLGRCIEAR